MFRVACLSECEKDWLLGLRPDDGESPRNTLYTERILAKEDKERLKQFVKKGVIFSQMTIGEFSFEVRFFAHPPDIYELPETLFIVRYRVLKDLYGLNGHVEVAHAVGRDFTHAVCNKEILRFYGMSQPEPSECCY